MSLLNCRFEHPTYSFSVELSVVRLEQFKTQNICYKFLFFYFTVVKNMQCFTVYMLNLNISLLNISLIFCLVSSTNWHICSTWLTRIIISTEGFISLCDTWTWINEEYNILNSRRTPSGVERPVLVLRHISVPSRLIAWFTIWAY